MKTDDRRRARGSHWASPECSALVSDHAETHDPRSPAARQEARPPGIVSRVSGASPGRIAVARANMLENVRGQLCPQILAKEHVSRALDES